MGDGTGADKEISIVGKPGSWIFENILAFLGEFKNCLLTFALPLLFYTNQINYHPLTPDFYFTVLFNKSHDRFSLITQNWLTGSQSLQTTRVQGRPLSQSDGDGLMSGPSKIAESMHWKKETVNQKRNRHPIRSAFLCLRLRIIIFWKLKLENFNKYQMLIIDCFD